MPFIKPGRLRSGMTVGIVAPSSAVRDNRLEKGIARLEQAGFRVAPGDHLYDRHGYLAGSDEDRAHDLTSMFAAKDIHAVLCARGGYGACRMVDLVDWNVVKANPKPFIGYSDITTLHLAMEKRAGIVSFHGPMAINLGGDLSDAALECFMRMLTNPEPMGALNTSATNPTVLVGGKVQGRLAGGCMELLINAVGTPDQTDFADRIVILEDIGMGAYRVDRTLCQLRRAGLLERAAGFVLGTVTDWDKDAGESPAITLSSLWQEYIVPLGKPAISGFPFGHVPNPLTLPLGCMAELNADMGELSILEGAVT